MAPPEYHYPVYECFEDFSLWPCISSSVLASLFALTFLIALAVLIPVLYKTRRWWGHQQVILFLVILEMLLGILRYAAFKRHGLGKSTHLQYRVAAVPFILIPHPSSSTPTHSSRGAVLLEAASAVRHLLLLLPLGPALVGP